MIVKVCGMTEAENIRAVDALGIDLMGFIFYEKSPRAAISKPAHMPEHAERVGVFVNHSTDFIISKAGDFSLRWAQLHGSESPDQCRELSSSGMKVIKAFSISSAEDLRQTDRYTGCCDLFLFDTKTPGVGGSGRSFDWTLLEGYCGPVPFLLSGGIGPDTDLSTFNHDFLAGIDLNSRFETAPGLKDAEALGTFIRKFRQL